VNFDVHQGDILGVIGRNGAGKSTLLKILSRITEPTSGRIEMYGRIGSLLEVGTGFHGELTGRENIYLNGAILGMEKREIVRRFDEIVAFSEVERFLDTPVKHYSSGMYMRLAFSVAAHLDPEILVVDEVLAVGDSAFQRKCLGKMSEVGRQGRTILFVSHNMAAIQQLTRSCIVLEAGRIAYHGPTEAAVTRYLNQSRELASTTYDVRNTPRRYPELRRQVEFVSLEVGGGTAKLIGAREPIVVNLQLHANQDAKDWRVCFIITRVDGSPVGTGFGPCIHSASKGQDITLEMIIADHHLAAGMYYLDLAVGWGNPLEGHKDFDVVTEVCYFEVMPVEGVDGSRAGWTPGWGSIHYDQCVTRELHSVQTEAR
jgi:lipopolysaccharide transport system ATP-binding protein